MRSSLIFLRTDAEDCEGYINNIARWRRDYSPLARADLLRDWIYSLEVEYSVALQDFKIEGSLAHAAG